MYFKEIIKQYSEQLTNTAKTEKPLNHVSVPTITICTGYKDMVLKELKIPQNVFYDPEIAVDLKPTDDIKEIYNNVTYKLNKDFKISFEEIFLNEGINEIRWNGKNYSIEIRELISYQERCYSMIPRDLIEVPTNQFLRISVGKNSTSTDSIQKLKIFLSSNESYLASAWPFFSSESI